MCTAISWNSGDHYFGRNLDLDRHFNEAVTVTPRNFPLYFRTLPPLQNHYAIIGIATVIESYPLYYDATNEFGLSMAALNFPGNAFYPDIQQQNGNSYRHYPMHCGYRGWAKRCRRKVRPP